MDRIGVVDTMFARYDMGAEALDELAACPGFGTTFEVVRRTVPGFKDLGVECKRLIEERGLPDRGGPRHARQGRHRPGLRPRGVPGASCRPSC